MSDDFLHAVARYQLSLRPVNDWSHVHFVFPNRRSGLFFARALNDINRHNPRTIFGLDIQTMGDMLASRSKLSLADPLTLACELYLAYSDVAKRENIMPRDFDNFYSWSATILSDFDDIDKNLVDAQRLYTNIDNWQNLSDDLSYLSPSQVKAIQDFWHDVVFENVTDNLGNEKLVHRRFLEEYRLFGLLYTEFRSRLQKQGIAYPGMIFSAAAQNDVSWDDPTNDQEYVFVGFSLLSRAEERILHTIAKRPGRAQFFWDYTQQMLQEEHVQYSAGKIISRLFNQADLASPRDFTPPMGDWENKEISVAEVTYPFSQCLVAKHRIRQLINEGVAPSQIAVVVPDESVLMHLIGSVPPEVSSLNVSMGYRLRGTNLYALLALLVDIRHAKWQRTLADNSTAFSHQVIIPLLQQPCVAMVEGRERLQQKIVQLKRENKIYITRSDFADFPFVSYILSPLSITDVVDYVIHIVEKYLDACCSSSATDDDKLDRVGQLNKTFAIETLKACRLAKLSLATVLQTNAILDVRTLLNMILSIVARGQVNFKGEPLTGLQIIGILETRALDFDHLIILDMNEGSWPHSSLSDSLIPHTLRRAYGLSDSLDVDNSYAYYFYRLIERAKSVSLIRPTISSKNNVPSSASRLLLQLQLLEKRLPVKNNVCSYDINLTRPEPIIIDKRDIASLFVPYYTVGNDGRMQKALSPSSVSNYVACSLKFFFLHVLGVHDDDDIEEEVDARLFGNIYHAVMEELYKSRLGAEANGNFIITQQFKDELLSDENVIRSLVMKHLNKQMHSDIAETDLRGRNVIVFNTIVRFVQLTVKSEQPSTQILAVEKKVHTRFQLSNGKSIEIKGTIDRQHLFGGVRYVMDYKTGKVKVDSGNRNFNVNNISTLFDQA